MTEITKPGFYNLADDLYHADPCPVPSLSCSIAKMLVTRGTTPLHAWFAHPRLNPEFKPEESKQFDLGRAAHSLILKDPEDFDIVSAEDWRTKVAQERRELARKEGRIPILEHQYREALAMVEAADAQLDMNEEACDFFKEGFGIPEQTMVWREGEVWCRSRLDWLPEKQTFFPDYKSTSKSADPKLWEGVAMGTGFDIQAAFYCRGLKALGVQKPEFRFVVQENYAPYALSVIALSPSVIDLAERKVELAIQIWRSCMQQNTWPGYPPYTSYLETRSWDEADFLMRADAYAETLRAGKNGEAPP
jgi:hypothetical protein